MIINSCVEWLSRRFSPLGLLVILRTSAAAAADLPPRNQVQGERNSVVCNQSGARVHVCLPVCMIAVFGSMSSTGGSRRFRYRSVTTQVGTPVHANRGADRVNHSSFVTGAADCEYVVCPVIIRVWRVRPPIRSGAVTAFPALTYTMSCPSQSSEHNVHVGERCSRFFQGAVCLVCLLSPFTTRALLH